MKTERVQYWDQISQHEKYEPGYGLPRAEFFGKFLSGKSVLEIGPGMGNATGLILDVAESYSIADISKTVLGQLQFSEFERFHITSYDVDFGRKYDAVYFWYVLAHVVMDEVPEFVEFLKRHLKQDGVLVFNSPEVGDEHVGYTHSEEGDGILTTRHRPGDIAKVFESAGFTIEHSQRNMRDSLMMVCRLTDEN